MSTLMHGAATHHKRAKHVTTVAEFLTQQIAMSPKSQREIAREVGYENPNMITMIKQGLTKLPISKVAPMAKSLGLDPSYLLRIAMTEYQPDTWAALEEILGRQWAVSEEDMALLGLIHSATSGVSPDVSAEDNRQAIVEAIQQCVTRDAARANASIARQATLPPNMRKR